MPLPARGGAGRLTLKANGGEEISQRHTLGLIFVGGFTGTIARALLQTIIPGGDWPWATFAVNLAGAFALGMVSEYVIVSRASQDRRNAVRFALGTGLLGSFTTYSALAHQVAAAPAVSGLGYGLASVAGGGITCCRRDRSGAPAVGGELMILLLTGFAGALGAVLRYAVDAALGRLHRLPLPIGTWTINVTGSLALGLLSGWQLPAGLVAVLGTGLCGGFTTFSTASVEAVRLTAQPLIAAGYVLITLGSCVGAVILGQALVA